MIQNVPFTFDELPEIAKSQPEVVKVADEGKRWTVEEMYRTSMYLVSEECHPMMFDLELEMIGKQRVNLVDELKVYIGPRLKNFVKIYAVKLFNLCK